MIATLESGKLCAECIGGRCKDAPTQAMPTSIECPECGGFGTINDRGDECQHCSGGHFDLTTCPYRFCGSHLELSHFAGLAENGLLPEAGGLNDQANWFIQAHKYLISQRNGIKTREING